MRDKGLIFDNSPLAKTLLSQFIFDEMNEDFPDFQKSKQFADGELQRELTLDEDLEKMINDLTEVNMGGEFLDMGNNMHDESSTSHSIQHDLLNQSQPQAMIVEPESYFKRCDAVYIGGTKL